MAGRDGAEGIGGANRQGNRGGMTRRRGEKRGSDGRGKCEIFLSPGFAGAIRRSTPCFKTRHVCVRAEADCARYGLFRCACARRMGVHK